MAQQQTGDLRHARTGIELRPGLEGVPATQSSICDIDGDQGLLTYRGYPMQDLAANSSFLETAYLLIWGSCPAATSWRSLSTLCRCTGGSASGCGT